MRDFTESVSERFIRYTQFDTMSDPSLAGRRRPTTDGQVVMQKALVAELEEMGLCVTYGPESVVHGILKGNIEGVPPVAFMAHVDTADDVMGNGVKAQVHDYMGGDIVLKGTVIRESDNPDLARHIGGRAWPRSWRPSASSSRTRMWSTGLSRSSSHLTRRPAPAWTCSRTTR